MIFELSKDKTLHSILSKVDLDTNTSELVKNNASVGEIKKSLIDNIDSSNIVSYRKYILKAEEEEENIRQREERQTTEQQKDKLIQLIAEKEGTSPEEVDVSLIPQNKKAARRRIKELTEELKTQKDIGVDEEVEETSELAVEQDKEKDVKEEKGAEERRLEAKKKEAAKNLNKASSWLEEVKLLVEKLKYSVTGNELKVKRMTEYQKFGNSITESNEVISLLMLYENNPAYLSDRFSEVLISYDFGKGNIPNVLMPYTRLKGTDTMMPNPKKSILVGKLDEGWSKLTQADFEGFKLSDIVKEMHRKRHGRQPIVDRKDKTRKEELQRLQRYIMGESPKDARKFDDLEKLVRKITRQVSKNRANKLSIEDAIKRFSSLDDKEIIANKIRRLNAGVKNLSRYFLRGALGEIKDIQENPEKYIEEFTNELNESIEKEKERLTVITNELDKLEKILPIIQRVTKALGQIDNLREDTGKEPSGELKRILGRLTVHIIRLERVSNKLFDKTEEVDEESDDLLARLGRGEVVENVVDFTSVESVRGLQVKFTEYKENIDSIMNEYDNLVGDGQ